MNKEIKECIETKDIKGLHYIFVDSLDVDPTFENYKDDYNACKKVLGFIEDYKELTPLNSDPKAWDEDYWAKLKVDLLENFSEKRFYHMKEVARVLKADKIERLNRERLNNATEIIKENKIEKTVLTDDICSKKNKYSFDEEAQERERIRLQKEIEENNRRILEEEKRKKQERERKITELAIENKRNYVEMKNRKLSVKKVIGVVVTIIVVLLIVYLLIAKDHTITRHNPKMDVSVIQ